MYPSEKQLRESRRQMAVFTACVPLSDEQLLREEIEALTARVALVPRELQWLRDTLARKTAAMEALVGSAYRNAYSSD